jgi:hypothetical protein
MKIRETSKTRLKKKKLKIFRKETRKIEILKPQKNQY